MAWSLSGSPLRSRAYPDFDEIAGGSLYGASTITKPDGSRMPSDELAGARFQGRHVAQIAAKLKA